MKSDSQRPLRILVAGGGVAGGLIGGWLSSQEGVAVTVAERVTADDHANAGNGLNVGPNGLRLLASVWPDKVTELRAASLPWTRWLARFTDGSLAYEIPLEEVSQESGIRIRWSELYRLARSSAMGCLRYQTSVNSVEASSDGSAVSVSIESDKGEVYRSEFDLVIDAEGRYSKVRECLAGRPKAEQLGIANFRTLLDDGGRIPLDDMEQWFNGPARIIAFRLAGGLIYISGNLPIERGAPVTDQMKSKSFLREAYTPIAGATDPRLACLIDGFCATESSHHWARAQQIETRWSDLDGRVLYLGDAAHAMAPTLGQGATLAIEDAAAFMRLFACWKKLGGREATIRQLTSAFAHLRRDRVEEVRRFSEEASDVLLLGSDTEACLGKKREPGFREKLSRLYGSIPVSDEPYLAALQDAAQAL